MPVLRGEQGRICSPAKDLFHANCTFNMSRSGSAPLYQPFEKLTLGPSDMASPGPIATPTAIPIIKSRIHSDGELPVSIIKETRIPRELQKIFLESSRGGSVKQAPPGVTFTRNWSDKTKPSERKKRNWNFFGSREKKHIVFDRNVPVPSQRVGEGENNAAGCGETRWASACTKEKSNSAPRVPSRRSRGELSPRASPRGKIYAAHRPLTLISISRLTIGLPSENPPNGH
jgi:hypothetical protein